MSGAVTRRQLAARVRHSCVAGRQINLVQPKLARPNLVRQVAVANTRAACTRADRELSVPASRATSVMKPYAAAVPAKAGTHLSAVRAAERWTPLSSGKPVILCVLTSRLVFLLGGRK